MSLPAREAIRIHPVVRDSLRELLLQDMRGTGVGYTAVVKAAVDFAREDGRFFEYLKRAQQEVTQLDKKTRVARGTGVCNN